MDTPERATILVADDDPDIRELIARILEFSGHTVSTVSNGTAVLEAVPRLQPDLVILDVSMPGADGYEVCRQLQDAGPTAPPVIFLTAHGTTSDRVTGLDLGAVDYVVKPFETAELSARVRAALRQKAARDALAAEAAVDGLTGLLNRRELDTRAGELIALARRYGRALSCVMIDLDHFKRINDHYGHAAGDQVLREVAQRIRAACRSSDVAARYGGEEFMLLLPDTEVQGAVTVAEKLRTLVASQPVRVQPTGATGATPEVDGAAAEDGDAAGAAVAAHEAGTVAVPLRVSIGVAMREPVMHTPEALYSAADGALYRAKQAGRDRVVVAPHGAGLV